MLCRVSTQVEVPVEDSDPPRTVKKLTPCSPGDPAAKELTWNDVNSDELLEPPLYVRAHGVCDALRWPPQLEALTQLYVVLQDLQRFRSCGQVGKADRDSGGHQAALDLCPRRRLGIGQTPLVSADDRMTSRTSGLIGETPQRSRPTPLSPSSRDPVPALGSILFPLPLYSVHLALVVNKDGLHTSRFRFSDPACRRRDRVRQACVSLCAEGELVVHIGLARRQLLYDDT